SGLAHAMDVITNKSLHPYPLSLRTRMAMTVARAILGVHPTLKSFSESSADTLMRQRRSRLVAFERTLKDHPGCIAWGLYRAYIDEPPNPVQVCPAPARLRGTRPLPATKPIRDALLHNLFPS